MDVEFGRSDWPFSSTFRISNRVWTHAETVQAKLTEGGLIGRGEAFGVYYEGETRESLMAQLESVRSELRNGISRDALQSRLPSGGARNALDCALWDLEAKRAGRRVWELAGVPSARPLVTAYTLSMDTPVAMSRAAADLRQYSILKLKLGGDGDLSRVAAVRAARRDVDIIVDANQGWCETQLRELAPQLAGLGVKLIEQPLKVGADQCLVGFESPVPLCADESCQDADSLATLIGKYQFVNIKLDKTGGLTEALHLVQVARRNRFDLMVGCMPGSSLAVAPAFVVGQMCSVVDLDAPLLSASDVAHGIRYNGGQMSAPESRLWG